MILILPEEEEEEFGVEEEEEEFGIEEEEVVVNEDMLNLKSFECVMLGLSLIHI